MYSPIQHKKTYDMKIKINPRYEAYRTFIASLPRRFDREGEIIFRGRNVIKRFTATEGSGYQQVMIVKRYKRPNFFQKIAYTFFCKTKARRAYEHAEVLLDRSFLTPMPFAYIETRRFGLIDHCYFISDVDESHPISERLNEPEEFDRTLAEEFARFAARLHQQGIIDVDLNSTNVLYRPVPTGYTGQGHYLFSLIDINRMHVYPKGTVPPLAACMENLTRFTGRMDVFGHVASAYAAARGWSDEMVPRLIKTKREHDRRWRRRKTFLHRFKRRK